MAKLTTDITVTMNLRPCLVKQNKLGGISERQAALFHKWTDKEETTLKFNICCRVNYIEKVLKDFYENHILPNDVEIIKHTRTLGLVEYSDGTVAEVEPTRIKFIDEKIKEYAF